VYLCVSVCVPKSDRQRERQRIRASECVRVLTCVCVYFCPSLCAIVCVSTWRFASQHVKELAAESHPHNQFQVSRMELYWPPKSLVTPYVTPNRTSLFSWDYSPRELLLVPAFVTSTRFSRRKTNVCAQHLGRTSLPALWQMWSPSVLYQY